MIDYRSHFIALTEMEAHLKEQTFPEPEVTAQRDQQLSEVKQDRGLAVLGSLIDHLIRHASSDGQDLALLERAASVWQEGVDLYTSLSKTRTSMEQALLNPAAPTSFSSFPANSRILPRISLSFSRSVETM